MRFAECQHKSVNLSSISGPFPQHCNVSKHLTLIASRSQRRPDYWVLFLLLYRRRNRYPDKGLCLSKCLADVCSAGWLGKPEVSCPMMASIFSKLDPSESKISNFYFNKSVAIRIFTVQRRHHGRYPQSMEINDKVVSWLAAHQNLDQWVSGEVYGTPFRSHIRRRRALKTVHFLIHCASEIFC